MRAAGRALVDRPASVLAYVCPAARTERRRGSRPARTCGSSIRCRWHQPRRWAL